MMQAAHNVHFRRPIADRLVASLKDLLIAHYIAPLVPKVSTKGAKRTSIDAYGGWVQMRVDVVIGDVPVLALSDDVGQFADFV